MEVFAPAGAGYERFSYPNVSMSYLPGWAGNPLGRLWADYGWLPKAILHSGVDVIFTMGNFAVPSHLPQGLLFMWPYAIYPDDKAVWRRMKRRDQLLRRLRIASFKSRLLHADIVFPQTQTSFNRLDRYYSERITKMAIVPTAFSRLVPSSPLESPRIPQSSDKIDLLCLTRYYPHKNIEIFLEVGELIKAGRLAFRIITTLGEDQHPAVGAYLRNVDQRRLGDVLINIGPVPIDQVPSLYAQTKGLILPTLLESFSATYADSLNSGFPIFTSDRDFAQEVCRDAAWYFDPLDASSIVAVLQEAFSDPHEMKKRSDIGRERSETFPDWPEVAQMYISHLRALVQESGS